ncbi:RNA-binding protein Nova-1 [Fasciola hepatica]|uniref:RNA-binding protein Nova-1 n=1 Tax=Fasciola hepatica TaxID=6192 RepID=A0A4E0QWE2_FASHE|nr:RNA-binding protein Nova-1 [Fasciola hepatica]
MYFYLSHPKVGYRELCKTMFFSLFFFMFFQGNVHFKILVPSIAAGAIIGKGGEAITDIQNKTSAKVKMSKANDFYPGTTERVCLIIGTIESILRVFQYISEKIYEKPESLLRIAAKGGRMPTERHKQVKILVPNSTAGIIIGKGGSFIKEVKDNTGVFIQVSQKSKELNLAERCVTIAGK